MRSSRFVFLLEQNYETVNCEKSEKEERKRRAKKKSEKEERKRRAKKKSEKERKRRAKKSEKEERKRRAKKSPPFFYIYSLSF
jgi:hypothetical protein